MPLKIAFTAMLTYYAKSTQDTTARGLPASHSERSSYFIALLMREAPGIGAPSLRTRSRCRIPHCMLLLPQY